MYLFIRSSTNPGPRVSRIINFLLQQGNNIRYLSPIRTGDPVMNSVERAGDLGTYDYFDGNGYLAYLKFILKTNSKITLYLIQFRKELKLVHFSDLESVLFGGILCKLLGIKYIYNIHDNFFQRYEFSKFLSKALMWLECLYIKFSEITLVPEEFRKTAYPSSVHGKIQIFRNFPDFNVSTDRIPFSDDKIKIFYGGWISPNRHMDLFIKLADYLYKKGKKVEVITCGWGSNEYLNDLRSKFTEINVNFKYLGQLAQHDAIASLQECDISIAYYSPDKIINIYAASNKIPEILGSNTILITNSQSEIAKRLKQYKVSIQYNNDISEIYNEIEELCSSEILTVEMVNRANSLYACEYNPSLISKELKSIFNEIV